MLARTTAGEVSQFVRNYGGSGAPTAGYRAITELNDVDAVLSAQALIAYAGTLSNHPFGILTNNIERMRFDGVFYSLIGTGGALFPNTNDGFALGSGTNAFSDLFLASGGVINFNNGDVTATHSANALAFAGASSGYSFDAQVSVASQIIADGSGHLATRSYTVGTVPSAANDGRLIYVTDDVGGEVPAFSDGTVWRRVTDRTQVAV